MESRAILGDSLHKLKELPDNSIDMIATDPPYGYSFMGKEWDKVLPDKRIWKECLRVLKHGGFAFVMSAPRQDVLSRMIIDLEDAGFDTGFTSMYWAYASGFPKASNASKIIDKKLGVKPESGGMVKGMGKQNSEWNGKGVGGRKEDYYKPEYEKVKATSDKAKKMDGSYLGFQPKPAIEVIIVVMKPLSEKNYTEQAIKDGKGVTWLDNCRIPFSQNDEQPRVREGKKLTAGNNNKVYGEKIGEVTNVDYFNQKGRFPANLIVSDDAVNDGKTTKSSGGIVKAGNTNKVYGKFDKDVYTATPDDKGSFSRYFDIDKWWSEKGNDTKPVGNKGAPKPVKAHYSERVTKITSDNTPDYTPDDRGRFPANLIVSDEAVNTGKTTKSQKSNNVGGFGVASNSIGANSKDKYVDYERGYDDEGDFSRYFDMDKWWAQFIITPKPSKSEKNAGLDHLEKKDIQPAGLAGAIEKGTEKRRLPRQNSHPTVKPLKLMSYLISLGSREGDIVLEPFMGSGTTCLASKNMNRKYIGIEREEEYYKIACGRLGIEPEIKLDLPENETQKEYEKTSDMITEDSLIEIEKELGEPEKRAEKVIENLEDKQIMEFKCDVCGFVAKDQKAYDDHIPRAFHQDSL